MNALTNNRSRVSAGELAQVIYPGASYDFALPPGWLNAMLDKGFDPRGCVVWLYPRGFSFGAPAPLTLDAYNALSRHHELSDIVRSILHKEVAA